MKPTEGTKMDSNGLAERLMQALGGGKVVSVGSFKALGDVLGLPDCGQKDCPVHGTDDEPEVEERDALEMRPEEALSYAIQAAAGGDIALRDDKAYLARIFMRQSELWLLIKQGLEERLQRKAMQEVDPNLKRIADLESELSDAEEDKQELRGEIERLENALANSAQAETPVS